ncbi:hypothetical protein, partial [Streptococcus equi]|uniref:hypothetical protein n=1 Tax=Streptococcus equi TaxID=1336 RepID=UPI0005B804CD
MKLATGTKLGKDSKKNNLNNCSKWLAIKYKKSDRSLIVTVFLCLLKGGYYFGSIISVVGKATAGVIGLYEYQKSP